MDGAKATVIRTSILFTTGIGAQNGGQLIDAGDNVVTGSYVDGVFTNTATPPGPIRRP